MVMTMRVTTHRLEYLMPSQLAPLMVRMFGPHSPALALASTSSHLVLALRLLITPATPRPLGCQVRQWPRHMSPASRRSIWKQILAQVLQLLPSRFLAVLRSISSRAWELDHQTVFFIRL